MDTKLKAPYIKLENRTPQEAIIGMINFEYGFQGVIIKIVNNNNLRDAFDAYKQQSYGQQEQGCLDLHISGMSRILTLSQDKEKELRDFIEAKPMLESSFEIAQSINGKSKIKGLTATALAYYYKRAVDRIKNKNIPENRYYEATELNRVDLKQRASSWAKKSSRYHAIGPVLSSYAADTAKEKQKYTLLALQNGSIDAMLDLIQSFVSTPQATNEILKGTTLNFKLAREILETENDIHNVRLLFMMKEFGIGGKKVSATDLLNEILQPGRVKISISRDYTEALLELISLKLIIKSLNQTKKTTTEPQILSLIKDKVENLKHYSSLLTSMTPEISFEYLYYSGLACSITNNIDGVKKNWSHLLESLNQSHNYGGSNHKQIAQEVYLKYSEILIDEGGDDFYKNKDIKKYLKLAKEFECEEADAYLEMIDLRIKEHNKALRSAQKTKIIQKIQADQERILKEEQKQSEQKLELENRIRQQRLKSKKPTTITPEWISYAQQSEKGATVEAREAAADVIARMTAKAKKKAERPNALTEEKKLEQAEEVAIPELSEEEAETPILYINKTNRDFFLHVLDYASSRESSGNFGSTGSSDIKREDLMGLMKQTLAFVHKKEEEKSKGKKNKKNKSKKNKGKGSHTCFTIPRLDNRDGAASRMATVPHGQSDVLKTYVRELADYFLELGYNEETVMDIRDFETKQS